MKDSHWLLCPGYTGPMECPFCRISSMRRVVAGEKEIDRCLACGALWFDYGEVRELTEGRLAADPGEETPHDAPEGLLRRMHRRAASLSCPRCGGGMGAIDFQTTGIAVIRCRDCRGYLATRRSAAAISAKFRFAREHGETYARLGESLAGATKRRMELSHGPAMRASDGQIPLPVVVPLGDDGPAVTSFPVATWLLIGLTLGVYLFARMGGGPIALPGGLPGLPSGAGFQNVPLFDLLFFPFLHAGVVPLAAGALFLLVLADNVEDRMGWLPFLLLYLACGAFAGTAHMLWGREGGHAALGSAGAVAGILGAYLVFFPEVSIRMYGIGKISTVPAYMFACAWVAAAFLIGPGPFTDLLNPAPLSLPGNLAGFGAGVFGAVLWRLREESAGHNFPNGAGKRN
ncbi:MAG: rhomboid family intramembrane serine protease [Deltaproteobacteria bacterium]|nr:MAG: rhomboid family intramembrane serine protease [Deltaproteobacteria bacterium]